MITNWIGLHSVLLPLLIVLVIKQIGLPLCGDLILLITHMITERIGLHWVLLPLQIRTVNNQSCSTILLLTQLSWLSVLYCCSSSHKYIYIFFFASCLTQQAHWCSLLRPWILLWKWRNTELCPSKEFCCSPILKPFFHHIPHSNANTKVVNRWLTLRLKGILFDIYQKWANITLIFWTCISINRLASLFCYYYQSLNVIILFSTISTTLFPESFVFPQEGVVEEIKKVFLRPLPLVGRRKTLGTRLPSVSFHLLIYFAFFVFFFEGRNSPFKSRWSDRFRRDWNYSRCLCWVPRWNWTAGFQVKAFNLLLDKNY